MILTKIGLASERASVDFKENSGKLRYGPKNSTLKVSVYWCETNIFKKKHQKVM